MLRGKSAFEKNSACAPNPFSCYEIIMSYIYSERTFRIMHQKSSLSFRAKVIRKAMDVVKHIKKKKTFNEVAKVAKL